MKYDNELDNRRCIIFKCVSQYESSKVCYLFVLIYVKLQVGIQFSDFAFVFGKSFALNTFPYLQMWPLDIDFIYSWSTTYSPQTEFPNQSETKNHSAFSRCSQHGNRKYFTKKSNDNKGDKGEWNYHIVYSIDERCTTNYISKIGHSNSAIIVYSNSHIINWCQQNDNNSIRHPKTNEKC